MHINDAAALPQDWQQRRSRCEIWTRVMGYYRPYNSFNAGKKSEFHEREYLCEGNLKT